MRNVGLYISVSTQEQAERGWSVEGQIADLASSGADTRIGRPGGS